MLFSLLSLLLLSLSLPTPTLCAGGGDFYSSLPIPRDRLFCDGALPPGMYGAVNRAWEIRDQMSVLACGEWEPWSAANFTDLSDLCARAGNPEGNMGGMCAFRLGDPHRRDPVFDLRLAQTVLLYDTAVLDYCEAHCFCPETEDQYLATDLRAARLLSGVSAVRLPETGPTAAPEGGLGAVGRVGGGNGVGRGAAAGRVETAGRVRAYRGRGFQCMGVQGRGTSGMMSCYCGSGSGSGGGRVGGLVRGGVRAPVRAVTFFLGG
ncbi:hypothetical protein MMC27_004425 [Xylographa pallens]|nr:hypothetical protein [Xylographa pallens]